MGELMPLLDMLNAATFTDQPVPAASSPSPPSPASQEAHTDPQTSLVADLPADSSPGSVDSVVERMVLEQLSSLTQDLNDPPTPNSDPRESEDEDRAAGDEADVSDADAYDLVHDTTGSIHGGLSANQDDNNGTGERFLTTTNCHVQISSRDDTTWILKASQDIKAGSELLLDYLGGDLPNSELLSQYGFALRNNREDAVHLDLKITIPAKAKIALENLSPANLDGWDPRLNCHFNKKGGKYVLSATFYLFQNDPVPLPLITTLQTVAPYLDQQFHSPHAWLLRLLEAR